MTHDALLKHYIGLVRQPSDINEHLETLRAHSSRCRHVTEFGVRKAVSTTALLMGLRGKPNTSLHAYDIHISKEAKDLRTFAGFTEFVLHKKNVLKVEIEQTDLLFIDTHHTYGQLKSELAMHSVNVRRWIIIHDTETYGVVGQRGSKGMWPAINEFVRRNPWVVHIRHHHNNGLTVLKRT